MRDKEIGALPSTPKTASPKPERIEAGQRWLEHEADDPYCIIAVRNENRAAQIKFDSGMAPDYWYPEHTILRDTYLGGPSTAPIAPPVRPEPAVGQGPNAAPALPAPIRVIVPTDINDVIIHRTKVEPQFPFRLMESQRSTLCHTCRLGDACTHGPKVRESFIPKVDEWDLFWCRDA
jgi:hypothetical protein